MSATQPDPARRRVIVIDEVTQVDDETTRLAFAAALDRLIASNRRSGAADEPAADDRVDGA